MKRRDVNAGFWSASDTFNIVDAISIFFTFMYAAIVLSVIFNPVENNLLVLQENMNIPMMTILGGYFGDQMISRAKGDGKGKKDKSRFKEIEISDTPDDINIDDSLGGYANEYEEYIRL